MLVQGELQKAQLEQIASTSPTPTPTGRVYMDVTAPLAAIPKVYDGTAWRSLRMGQTTATIEQNSAKAVTVDWSTGLYQQVTLTDSCTISFSNPVEGEIHTLVVKQTINQYVPYLYTFNMADQDPRRKNYQPIGPIPYGNDRVHRWFYKAGIRAALTTIPANHISMANFGPATLITGIAIAPDLKNAAMGRTTSPYTTNYTLVETETTKAHPFGAAYATATAAAAQVVGVAYSPDNRSIFYATGTSPYIEGHVTCSLGVGTTVFTDPGILPTGAARCVAVHGSGLWAGVGHTTSPFMSVYPVVGMSFGTKIADPGTLPAAAVTSLAWSPQGDYIAAVSQSTPFLQVWPWTINTSTGNGTFGTVVANPGILPAGGPAGSLGKGVAWRPQGDYIAVAMTTTPYLYVVPFNRSTGAYGTALTISALSGAAVCVQWTPDGQYLLVGTGTTPYFYCYDFSAFTIGTPVAFDGNNPGQQINDMAVHPHGEYVLIGLNAGVFLYAWNLPVKARSYVRIES